jgi:glycosyltransferase involved in cell wall biosynthesis
MMKLKILHLTSAFEVGGQQRLISEIVRYDSPFNLHYLAILRRSTEALTFFKEEIQVLFYKGLSDDEIVTKLANFVTENSIDILFAHNRQTWDVAADTVKCVPGISVYVVAHTIDGKRYNESDSERMHRIKSNIVVTSKMICTSSNVKSEYLKLMPEEKEKIIRIYNGVEVKKTQIDSSRKNLRKSLGVSDNTILLGMVARLAKIKNQGFLIEAISKIVENGMRSFKLVIVGDGPEREHLLRKIQNLKLGDYIILKGNSFSTNEYYEAFDIFINCSLFESCSLAILEAMSHAIPVIASDVGGNREIVTNNETGFLFPLNNEGVFIERFKNLFNNPDIRSQMGKKGQDKVTEEFNIHDTVRNYQRLFEKESLKVGKELL